MQPPSTALNSSIFFLSNAQMKSDSAVTNVVIGAALLFAMRRAAFVRQLMFDKIREASASLLH